MKTPHVTVIGSAHLDVLAQADEHPPVIDRPGIAAMNVGGTAGHLAMLLQELGTETVLATAMNRSPFSRLVQAQLTAAGVRWHGREMEDWPLGLCVGHLNAAGEMDALISCTPIERLGADVDWIRPSLDDAHGVVLDCNLASETLRALVALAAERRVPVCLAGVSEVKCRRMAGVTDPVVLVAVNAREYAVLARLRARPAGAAVLVTEGAAGVRWHDPSGQVHWWPAPALPPRTGTRWWPGLGDVVLAGVLHGWWTEGRSPEESVVETLRRLPERIAAPAGQRGQAELMTHAERWVQEIYRDPLTHLPGRPALLRAMESWIARGPVAVMLVDLDGFKAVNDTYGHAAGDAVIQRAARDLRESIRTGDLVGRWGGEEFVVLALTASAEEAWMVAERIRSRLAQAAAPAVTASLGVAMSQPGENVEAVLERADQALYAAKRAGRNRTALAGHEEAAALRCAVRP